MKKVTGLSLVLVAVFSMFGVPKEASAEMFEYQYINGVGDYGNNTQFYWMSEAASSEETKIDSAMTKWVNSNGTGIYTPISFRQTTNQSASVMDIYKGSYYDKNLAIIAETYFFVNSTAVNPDAQNWYWCEIRLNSPVYSDYSPYDQEGTISHEMGHCMGLDHPSQTPYPVSVMLQIGQGRTVNAPQSYDLNDINKKY